MRQRAIILTFTILLVANNSFGQRFNYSTKNVKKLKSVAEANEGKIYIKTKLNENGDIYVFLINRTDSLLRPYLGHSPTIEFAMEALNTENKWQAFAEQSYAFYCAMGAQHVKLESNQYTWQKIPKKFYGGDYATSIRFSFWLNDSLTVFSKPVKVKIDPNLFLPEHERQLLQIDSLLDSQKTTQAHKERLLRFKLITYLRHADILRTVAVANEIVRANPHWDEGKFKLSTSLIRYIGKNRETLSDSEIALIVSKVLILCQQIPKENERMYKNAQVYLKRYHELLLTKTEWLKSLPNHYKQIGEDYYAPLPILDGELVKIKFRSTR